MDEAIVLFERILKFNFEVRKDYEEQELYYATCSWSTIIRIVEMTTMDIHLIKTFKTDTSGNIYTPYIHYYHHQNFMYWKLWKSKCLRNIVKILSKMWHDDLFYIIAISQITSYKRGFSCEIVGFYDQSHLSWKYQPF